MEANGSPKPEFETDDARSYFISRLFVHKGFLKEINVYKMSDKMSDKEKLFFELLLKQFAITEYVTTADMADISNIPISTVRRYMAKFGKLGVIDSKGKNKGTKYYLN